MIRGNCDRVERDERPADATFITRKQTVDLRDLLLRPYQ